MVDKSGESSGAHAGSVERNTPKEVGPGGCADRIELSKEEEEEELLRKKEGEVALGEIGIDFSEEGQEGRENEFELQKRLLREVLKGAKDHLVKGVPVIVTREAAATSSSKDHGTACAEMIGSVKEFLDPHHRVYVHCFREGGGGQEDSKRWIEAFPEVVFGLIGGRMNGFPQKDLLLELFQRGKWLLETDSPYFPPENVSPSVPYDVGAVLARLWNRLPSVVGTGGGHREFTMEEVVAPINKTFLEFFHIGP